MPFSKLKSLLIISRFLLNVLRARETIYDDQRHHNQRISARSFHFWHNFYDRTKTFFFINILVDFYHEWRFSPGGGSAPENYTERREFTAPSVDRPPLF